MVLEEGEEDAAEAAAGDFAAVGDGGGLGHEVRADRLIIVYALIAEQLCLTG